MTAAGDTETTVIEAETTAGDTAETAQTPSPVGVDGLVAEAAVVTSGLTKVYGKNVALGEVSVVVPAGSVCALIGPNGAGKSTLMSIVSTLLKPTVGTASVFGKPITKPAEIRPLIGYVPDVLGTYAGLTVNEYLRFFADAYRVPSGEQSAIVDGLLELVDLQSKRDSDVNTLSRGMKQRIALARALVHQPKLLILDEPASGLDPRARVELKDILLHLQSMGTTVLISSHILGELEAMCSHAIILEQGHLVGMEDLSAPAERAVVVTFAGGESETFTVADEEAHVELVRTLVNEGRPVVSVSEGITGLEERFLALTRGELN